MHGRTDVANRDKNNNSAGDLLIKIVPPSYAPSERGWEISPNNTVFVALWCFSVHYTELIAALAGDTVGRSSRRRSSTRSAATAKISETASDKMKIMPKPDEKDYENRPEIYGVGLGAPGTKSKPTAAGVGTSCTDRDGRGRRYDSGDGPQFEFGAGFSRWLCSADSFGNC